jgi:hypothetical protein
VERCVLWENTRIAAGVRLSECIVTGDLELRNVSHCGRIVTRMGVSPLF